MASLNDIDITAADALEGSTADLLEEGDEEDGTIAIDLRAADAAETEEPAVLVPGDDGDEGLAIRLAVTLALVVVLPPPLLRAVEERPSRAPRPCPVPIPPSCFAAGATALPREATADCERQSSLLLVLLEVAAGLAVAAVAEAPGDSERLRKRLLRAGGIVNAGVAGEEVDGTVGKSDLTRPSSWNGLDKSTASILKAFLPLLLRARCRKRMVGEAAPVVPSLPVGSNNVALRSPKAEDKEATASAAAAALSREKDLAIAFSSFCIALAASFLLLLVAVGFPPSESVRSGLLLAEEPPMSLTAPDSNAAGRTSNGLDPAFSVVSQTEAVGLARRVPVTVGAARTAMTGSCPDGCESWRTSVPGADGSSKTKGARPS
jgi:hypothetical protein